MLMRRGRLFDATRRRTESKRIASRLAIRRRFGEPGPQAIGLSAKINRGACFIECLRRGVLRVLERRSAGDTSVARAVTTHGRHRT